MSSVLTMCQDVRAAVTLFHFIPPTTLRLSIASTFLRKTDSERLNAYALNLTADKR